MFRHLCDMKAVHQAAYQARVQLHWHQRHHLPLCPGVAHYHSQAKGACPGTGAKQQQGIFQSSTNPMIPCGEQHAECQGKLFPHVGCHQRMQSGTHFRARPHQLALWQKPCAAGMRMIQGFKLTNPSLHPFRVGNNMCPKPNSLEWWCNLANCAEGEPGVLTIISRRIKANQSSTFTRVNMAHFAKSSTIKSSPHYDAIEPPICQFFRWQRPTPTATFAWAASELRSPSMQWTRQNSWPVHQVRTSLIIVNNTKGKFLYFSQSKLGFMIERPRDHLWHDKSD